MERKTYVRIGSSFSVPAADGSQGPDVSAGDGVRQREGVAAQRVDVLEAERRQASYILIPDLVALCPDKAASRTPRGRAQRVMPRRRGNGIGSRSSSTAR